MKTRRFSVTKRARGQAIIQGVIGFVIMFIGVIFGSILLLNVGGATYGKEKIGFITDQAARYATTLPINAARQTLVNTLVDELITSMGFNAANTVVTITDMSISGQPAVQVTVTTSLATLLTGNFARIFPQQITMPFTSTIVKNTCFNGYAVCTNLAGQSCVNPIVTTNGLPNDGLPGYVTTVMGMSKVR